VRNGWGTRAQQRTGCHGCGRPLDFLSIVSHARRPATAGFDPVQRGRSVVLSALLPTLVLATSLAVVVLPRPAAADQIADLKAQATAVSQKLVEEQLQIDAFQQQDSYATERVANDARTIATIGRQISHDERRIKKDIGEVRQDAIAAYMNADNAVSSSDALIFTGNVENVTLANEYNTVATENTENSIDQLGNAQRSLHTHQATLVEEQSQDQADQRAQATDLGQAVATEQQMESVQSEITGKLAVAVAAQASAQAAAAAAAVVAAQKAAAATAAPGTTGPPLGSGSASGSAGAGSGSGSGSGSVAVSDPTLNPFLQCVVQVESGGNYADVSPNGLYMGAFQFSQPTWNMAAPDAGLPGLVGVHPNLTSKADQDTVAVALYALDGEQPWLGDRCS
jgi:hypothetical protein